LGGDWGATDEQPAIAAVRRAADRGVNVFDTAQGYGLGASERLLAKALGTDYVDLFQVHWPDPHTPFAETAGALAELVVPIGVTAARGPRTRAAARRPRSGSRGRDR
jgi:aryl-alcohol dehydrogenase-like predicted oxidoreductase